MSDDDVPFFRRWSHRKRDSEDEARRRAEEEAARREEEPEAQEGLEERGKDPETAETLPDPETLGRDADWSVYLKKSVPEELRRRALRRLWRVDPVYANLDGLNDYDEDFNDPVLLSRKVKTLFQVGRGMVLPEQEVQEGKGFDEALEREQGDAEKKNAESSADLDAAELSGEEAGEGEDDSSTSRTRTIAPQAGSESSPVGKSKGSALKRRWGEG